MNKHQERKTFTTDTKLFVFPDGNSESKPIGITEEIKNLPVRAGGIVPYTIFNDGRVRFLMVYSNGRFSTDKQLEVLGGKTESYDKDIIDTIRREASEETNHIQPFQSWLASLPPNLSNTRMYFPNSKFLMLFAYMPSHFANILTTEKFGHAEFGEHLNQRGIYCIYRTIHWMTVDEIAKFHMVKYDRDIFYHTASLVEQTCLHFMQK